MAETKIIVIVGHVRTVSIGIRRSHTAMRRPACGGPRAAGGHPVATTLDSVWRCVNSVRTPATRGRRPGRRRMAAARESLLDAAYTALTERAWAAVRMVDVAAAAGVSRQTLYNEFGSKEGLARALVRRETDHYLAGVARALSQGAPAAGAGGDAAGRVAAAAAWTLRTARANPLVRAALTGCWGDRLPTPAVAVGE
ncbi:TetR/AcrR family transcriptional regulator, partial [Streptomyces tubercidicus]